MSSLLGITKEGDDYYVLNLTENFKARLVNWFGGLEERIVSMIKTGTSVALIGPHGSGKSVVARYIAARLVGEYYAVIDLGVDVATFDSMLEILHEAPSALGFYDPIGITFYDSPLLPRSEPATQWMTKCRYIIDRAMYLATRDIPTLLVLPYDLLRYSRCREAVERNMRIIDISEYLRRVDLRRVLEDVFESHAAAHGCRKTLSQFVEYIIEKHSDLSGVVALAAYGGRYYARRRCVQSKPENLYEEALRSLAKLYYDLYSEVFFPTCQTARALATPLWLSLEGQQLPADLAYPLANVDSIARRIALLSKLGPQEAGVKEEVLEELKELYTPREELAPAVKWAVAPKESIIRESLRLTARENPCLLSPDNPARLIRTVYKGLLVLDSEIIFEFAKVIASLSLGQGEFCMSKIGKYVCKDGQVPPVVVDALGMTQGRRITQEVSMPSITRCDEEGIELLAGLALLDARRAPAKCVEKFVQLFYSASRSGLEFFYKFYQDYLEIAAERGTMPVLRKLAAAHLSRTPPREAVTVLEKVFHAALGAEDYKTAEIAAVALAAADLTSAKKIIPSCDCPILKISVALHIARSAYERGDHQEAIRYLELALAELKVQDPRYEYTPQFVKQIEELYRDLVLQTVL